MIRNVLTHLSHRVGVR